MKRLGLCIAVALLSLFAFVGQSQAGIFVGVGGLGIGVGRFVPRAAIVAPAFNRGLVNVQIGGAGFLQPSFNSLAFEQARFSASFQQAQFQAAIEQARLQAAIEQQARLAAFQQSQFQFQTSFDGFAASDGGAIFAPPLVVDNGFGFAGRDFFRGRVVQRGPGFHARGSVHLRR